MSDTERDVAVFLDMVDEDRELLNRGLVLEGLRISRALGGELRALRRSGDEPPVEEVAERAATLLEAEGRPRLVILADTDRGRELAPFLAHRAGTQAVVGVTDILVGQAGGSSEARPCIGITYVKPVCGGQLEQELNYREGSLELVTMARSALISEAERGLPPGDSVGKVAEVCSPGTKPGGRRKARVAVIAPDFRTVDIVHARRLVAAGLGAQDTEVFRQVHELAKLLEASLGATRPMVDDGILPKERMIGRTGKSVTPELYLALGLSGSPHHVAGFQGAGRVLAVNMDQRAPIFGFADAGWVADLRDVLPHLIDLITQHRNAGEPGSERHEST
ncbi:MAG: electron transfer flavoprotein subunit alpha/FixB family protein [Gaiellales bacterium]|nr:electron transfer flavoprotein subunit alpha/FixB family protein [Gaiellales bacterium]